MASSIIAADRSHEGVQPERPRKHPVSNVSQVEQVLTALVTAESALTVDDIAQRTNCSSVTVRRHLKALREADRVQQVGRRPRIRHTEDGTPRTVCGRGPELYAAA